MAGETHTNHANTNRRQRNSHTKEGKIRSEDTGPVALICAMATPAWLLTQDPALQQLGTHWVQADLSTNPQWPT